MKIIGTLSVVKEFRRVGAAIRYRYNKKEIKSGYCLDMIDVKKEKFQFIFAPDDDKAEKIFLELVHFSEVRMQLVVNRLTYYFEGLLSKVAYDSFGCEFLFRISTRNEIGISHGTFILGPHMSSYKKLRELTETSNFEGAQIEIVFS